MMGTVSDEEAYQDLEQNKPVVTLLDEGDRHSVF